jgi:hypothetical protein
VLEDLGLEESDIRRNRLCANCNDAYSIVEYLSSSEHYFWSPYDYNCGCLTHCLNCWLGCGPESMGPEGNILRECGLWLAPGVHLALMPIPRVTLDSPLIFPGHTIFYPPGVADLASLNLLPNDAKTRSLAERLSVASGIDLQTIDQHATVALPVRFDWEALFRLDHQSHMEFIRSLSEAVDDACLNLIRYRLCRIEPVDVLPGRAGQIDNNHMMSGALLYNAARQQGRIIGGAAFTHFITRGLGLPIEAIESEAFPTDGEVGHIAKHSLSLYTALMEANNPTAKFVQGLALLEFLADPHEYRKFEDVKKTVARYVARTQEEYMRLLERFLELTGKKDPRTQQIIGYRSRIVHIGERLDKIIPNPRDRRRLFEELDTYIRPIIDHMITHSHLNFEQYLEIRDKLRPFEP